MRISLVTVAVLFSFSGFAGAQESCSASKSKDKQACSASKSAQACSASKTTQSCCAVGKKTQASLGATETNIDSKVLKRIYLAASSGDFSKMAACPTSRAAMIKLSQGNEHTCNMIQTAEKNGDYSNVAACKVTRSEIKQAALDRLLGQQGLCPRSLKKIQQAAASGDFSEVAKCKTARATLKKVVLAAADFNEDCKEKVMEVVDGVSDFSLVAACKTTRAEIQKAVEELKANTVETALK